MLEHRILFTGVGRRIELVQAFRQAALVMNRIVKIYGADMTGTAPALSYCDYVRHICGMKDDNYIPELLEICKKDKINLVIPTIDTDLLVLSENRDLFEQNGIKVLIAAPEMIRICRDKNLTSSFFVECGLLAPMPVNNWKEYADVFPAFIKPKDGSSSIDAFKVNNKEELEMYSKQVDDYIVQPFVEGMEYTIDIFCDFEGKPISIVPRERMQVRAGEVLKTKICMDEIMIEEAKVLCDRFKPCGPMTVQLIRDNKSKRNYYIEINPRFGGGAPLSMKAGGRSAEAVLKLLENGTADYCKEISNGAIYSRFDQSVCMDDNDCYIKGVIFDLDDTLYSETDYVKSGFEAVADYLGDRSYSEQLWQYFLTEQYPINVLLKELGRENELKEVIEVYRGHFPRIKLYDGVIDLITRLKEKNIKVGIITDGRPEGQRNKIQALGLDTVVDDIIITDELGGEQFRKPCDIGFRIMQTRWRLNMQHIAYVGDNADKDFQAAKQLGMKGIYYKNREGLYFNNHKEEINGVSIIDEISKVENIVVR